MIRITKSIWLILTIILSITVSAYAADIPRESLPEKVTEDAVILTEELISEVLDEVSKLGLGYADAKSECNRIIFNEVVKGNTNGYGYGILTFIANNAIFQYRDMYLRPDYYVELEKQVRVIISDLITAVENGYDYNAAKKEAYILIYKSVDPNFDTEQLTTKDFCYWDIPAVDSAMFNRARKLLFEAQERYKINALN